MQGIQPKSNNNGKAQMFVILLASMWHGHNFVQQFGLMYINKLTQRLDLQNVYGPGFDNVVDLTGPA